MNTRLARYLVTIFAVGLTSCQPPYVDREARSSVTGPPAPQLSAPSLHIDDAHYDSSVDVKRSVTAADTAAVSVMLGLAQQIASDGNLVATQTDGSVVPAQGLPGYQVVNSLYDIERGKSSLTFNNIPAGTAVEEIQDYEELSEDYALNEGSAAKLFTAATHAVYRDYWDRTIAYSDGGTLTAQGTFLTKVRGEWFQDINDTIVTADSTFGTVEAAAGMVLAVTYNDKGTTLGGKILMTAVKSLPYVSNTNAGGSQSVTLTYKIDCYEQGGTFIDSTTVGGITSLSLSAHY